MNKLMLGDNLIAESSTDIRYNDQQSGWEVDGVIYADAAREMTVMIDRVVSVTAFKLLFTSPERIAVYGARATDAAIDDFLRILDDPRTEEVHLGLSSVQAMLDYLTSKSLLDAGRKAQIIDGAVL